MAKADDTLERLIAQGRCSCANVNDYAKQLTQLADKSANRNVAKRRGKFFKALGDETRQRMLGLLLEQDMCVCELITALNMMQPTASHHLSILEAADLVQGKKEGKWVFYGIRDKQFVSDLIEKAK